MSFALGFFYIYAIGALACAMWLLKEMRKRNEDEKRGHEDYAIAAACILIASLWLPIAVTLFVLVIVTIGYSSLWP